MECGPYESVNSKSYITPDLQHNLLPCAFSFPPHLTHPVRKHISHLQHHCPILSLVLDGLDNDGDGMLTHALTPEQCPGVLRCTGTDIFPINILSPHQARSEFGHRRMKTVTARTTHQSPLCISAHVKITEYLYLFHSKCQRK